MSPIPFIDTHVHLWDPARLTYRWLAGVPPLNRAFLPADFRFAAGRAMPDRVVFVECGRDPSENVTEAEWVSSLAAQAPWIAGIVAHASVEKGREVVAELEALSRVSKVRGVRRLLQDEPDPDFCMHPKFVAGVRALEAFGYTFDLCVYHPQLPAVTALVEACPGVRFVLDHLGKPGVKAGSTEPWATHLTRLAKLPNVWCKVSGLATEADPARWREDDLRPYLDRVLEAFGPGRLLFGGDWPVSTLATTYPRWFDVVSAALARWPEGDRRKVWMDNAIEFYRLSG